MVQNDDLYVSSGSLLSLSNKQSVIGLLHWSSSHSLCIFHCELEAGVRLCCVGIIFTFKHENLCFLQSIKQKNENKILLGKFYVYPLQNQHMTQGYNHLLSICLNYHTTSAWWYGDICSDVLICLSEIVQTMNLVFTI